MIFYFTGTGNSLYAANQIAKALGDQLYSIAKLMDLRKDSYEYELGKNEILGFVFPVYAWGPPRIVLDFISRLGVKGNPYVFSLNTCGEEEGNTSKIVRKALAARGLILDGAFCLRMPNNYIVGFDVDSSDVEAEKLKAAELMLSEINKVIAKRQPNVDLTMPGRFPAVKTFLINSLFNTFALNAKYFYADDSCTHCGLCEEICPVHTIKVTDTEKPVWGKDCTQCQACINRCPERAIQLGKGSAKKGRYHHPELDRLEK